MKPRAAGRPAARPPAHAADHEPLGTYRAKRDFSRTPEPAEGGERATGDLTYVIHKHWASHLHYDLRLEIDGVMVSWAVPKGPSYDPKDKRMAVHVEDHPISYSSFEGTIPKGQYGAGKVIVWDRGHWRPLGDPAEGLRAGQLKFELLGHKLRGRWALVRMKGHDEKHEPWLFIKEKDALARPASEFSVIDERPDSVADSGKPLKLPATLAPQLATLVDRPPADTADWLFEIKFDGYRLLARIEGSDIKLFTRNGLDWSAKLASLKSELQRTALPDGWYDGEIVVADEKGRPDFGALQQAFDGAATHEVDFHLFDLPCFQGRDLRDLPLQTRREILASTLATALARQPSERLRLSQAFDEPADQLLASACQLGLEGVIGKRRDSPYRSGRSTDWIKLKCGRRQEFVVGGYTAPRGRRSGFGSLMLGVHDAEGALQYAGNVGSGFDDRTLAELKRRLDPQAATSSPFAERVVRVGTSGTPHWVEPTLVVEVSFAEWTREGRVRHAVFRGLRADKPAREIRREEPRAIGTAASARTAAPRSNKVTKPTITGPSTKLKVSHGDRVIDATSGITKIDLVRYYDSVGALMKPHLAGRPTSVVRAPDGVDGELFFQKHIDTQKMPGLRVSPCAGSAPGIEVATPSGLLSLAQWNVIELHTSNMRAAHCGTPDRVVFDLDPGEGVGWPQVQEAAELVRGFLDQLGLAAFLKTSGGKGLHLVVPIKPVLDFEPVKAFAHAIVTHIAQTIPQRFVAVSGPKNRVRRIFIDYLRNGEAATTVSAWSARARPGMGISVPVGWDELAQLRGGDHWTVRSVHERLGHGNEPWSGYARSARALRMPMKKLGFVP